MIEVPAFHRFFPEDQLTDEFLDMIQAMIKYLEQSGGVAPIVFINYPSLQSLDLDEWAAKLETNPEPFLGCFSLAATDLYNRAKEITLVSKMEMCKGILVNPF
jgi:hypothetical protein